MNMLGAITLIGTASINTIAFDSGEKPSPQPIPISKNKFTELSKLNVTTIWSSVSYDDIIYIGTNDGVYQNSVENENNFLQINGITGSITSLATDKDGNIYAATQYSKIYKKQKNQNIFTLIKELGSTIWSITTTSDGTIYVR